MKHTLECPPVNLSPEYTERIFYDNYRPSPGKFSQWVAGNHFACIALLSLVDETRPKLAITITIQISMITLTGFEVALASVNGIVTLLCFKFSEQLRQMLFSPCHSAVPSTSLFQEELGNLLRLYICCKRLHLGWCSRSERLCWQLHFFREWNALLVFLWNICGWFLPYPNLHSPPFPLLGFWVASFQIQTDSSICQKNTFVRVPLRLQLQNRIHASYSYFRETFSDSFQCLIPLKEY